MHSFVDTAIFWGASLTLQKNDLILPQAISELRKTVTRLAALKFKAKAVGMLEKMQTMLAQQQGDEEIPGVSGWDFVGIQEKLMMKTDSQCENQCICCTIERFENKEGNAVDKSLKKYMGDRQMARHFIACLCVWVISVKGNNTEGKSERLHRPHQSPAEGAHGGGHQHWHGWPQSLVWWLLKEEGV